MNLRSKKIVARELLIILFIVIIGFLAFVMIYPYNSYQKTKAVKLKNEISEKANQVDRLNKILYPSQIEHLYEVTKEAGLFFHKDTLTNLLLRNPRSVYSVISSDKELKNLFLDYSDFENILGLSTNNVLTTNISKRDSLQELLNMLKHKEAITSKKILTRQEQLRFTLMIILSAAIVLILLRYALYVIKWSIKTLQIRE